MTSQSKKSSAVVYSAVVLPRPASSVLFGALETRKGSRGPWHVVPKLGALGAAIGAVLGLSASWPFIIPLATCPAFAVLVIGADGIIYP